jgi:hypothetical protein
MRELVIHSHPQPPLPLTIRIQREVPDLRTLRLILAALAALDRHAGAYAGAKRALTEEPEIIQIGGRTARRIHAVPVAYLQAALIGCRTEFRIVVDPSWLSVWIVAMSEQRRGNSGPETISQNVGKAIHIVEGMSLHEAIAARDDVLYYLNSRNPDVIALRGLLLRSASRIRRVLAGPEGKLPRLKITS